MKSVGRIETDADLILQQAVDTLVSRWGQTKLSTDGGNGPVGPGQSDRHKVLKIVVRRALAMNMRGSIGRSVPATNIPAGTTSIY